MNKHPTQSGMFFSVNRLMNMRSVLYATLVSVFIITAMECGYRYTGGIPTVMPGKTHLEFQWKIKQARADKVIYFIGDSRVDWGFADRLFTEQFKQLQNVDIQAVNAGLSAGSVSEITKYILNNHPNTSPGVLVINYTPAGFCHFTTSPGKTMSNLKRQDYLDHRIANYLVEWLFTYGRSPKFLFRHFEDYKQNGYTKRLGWFTRTIYRDGFVTAEARYNDGSERVTDVGYYQQLFQNIRRDVVYYNTRKHKTISAIFEAQGSGWTVILVRFPIGEEMLNLEKQLPKYFQPERVASEMSSPFIDYTTDHRISHLSTDESHLHPDSAREFAPILAQDMAQFFPFDLDTGITIRRATVDDKEGICRTSG